jgi:hypothetical protein
MLILGAVGAFGLRPPLDPYSLWSHPPFRGQTHRAALE